MVYVRRSLPSTIHAEREVKTYHPELIINMTSKIILILTRGFLLHTTASAQTGTPKDALAALKRYDDAWNRKDAKGVGAILPKDYLYFSSEGGTTTRERILEFWSRRNTS
jgi:hypothetical protein